MANRSFTLFVEQELGKVPHFLIFAVLEWILILALFIDGFLTFLSNEFAKFFELEAPCFLCARIDRVLVHRNPAFYYNESICESHKKRVSSLAYCHVHKKLSEIKKLCEGCLLSFATEKETDCDTYKSLLGILHKDLELLVDDDQDIQLSFPSGTKKDDVSVQVQLDQKNNVDVQWQQICSCCSEPLKVRRCKPKNGASISQTPAPSPLLLSFNQRNFELPHMKYTEFKYPENESDVHEEGDPTGAINRAREEAKTLLADMDESNEDKSPSFIRGGNRFFGIPLSDSAQNSPRWPTRSIRKSPIERTENGSDSTDPDGSYHDAMDGETILHHLKRQVRLDRKSLMDLYMELDEERSASAVAANNAMAMITRLQAEKAAVRMDALHYQRMMDEQAEYDQEALQHTKVLLVKREEEIKELEAEIEIYREKYGCLHEGEESLFELQGNTTDRDHYHDLKPASGISNDHGGENEDNHDGDDQSPSGGKSPDLGRKRNLDKKLEISLDDAAVPIESSTEKDNKADEETAGKERKTVLIKELSEIRERLNALEADGGLLKHVSEVLPDASEGEALLKQISHNLLMLRSFLSMPHSENGNA